MLRHRIKKLSDVSSNDECLWGIVGRVSKEGELEAELVKCEFWSDRGMVKSIGKSNFWIGEKPGKCGMSALPRLIENVYSATVLELGFTRESPFGKEKAFLLLFRKKKQAMETIESGQLAYHVKLELRVQHRKAFLAELDRAMKEDCMYCGEHLRDCNCNVDAAFGDGDYNGTEPPKTDDVKLDMASPKPMPCGKAVLNPHINRED